MIYIFTGTNCMTYLVFSMDWEGNSGQRR